MSSKKEVIALTIVWAITTAIGIAWSMSVGIFPSPASKEAQIVDHAMTLLLVLSVPVFMMVVVVLVYSVIRFRQRGEPTEDGPPLHGNLRLTLVWVAVSTALVLFLAAYGSVGLMELWGHQAQAAENELVVQPKASRWFWQFTYPELGITSSELRLPEGRRVRFEITATDVLHSFWVPAFRVKIDAVPGLVTIVHATPDRIGSFQEDYQFRVQCTQLCGLAHSAMASPVIVMEQREFDSWVAQQKTN